MAGGSDPAPPPPTHTPEAPVLLPLPGQLMGLTSAESCKAGDTVQPGAVTHKSSGDGGQRHYSFPGGSLDTLEPVPDWVKLCAHLYPSLPGKSLLHLGESSSTGSIPHPALKLCPAVVLSALCGLQVTTSLQLLPSAGPCHYRQVLECVPGNQNPCSQLGWIIWAKGNPPPLYLEAMAALCEPDLVVCASDRCQEGAECSISDQRSAISDQRSAISS
jgi:hypothetical protein